jgi:hypothetical protein
MSTPSQLVTGAEAPHAGRALIPGAYEPRPITPRQPGAIGGPPFGAPAPPGDGSTMSDATIVERRKEGGGGRPEVQPRAS